MPIQNTVSSYACKALRAVSVLVLASAVLPVLMAEPAAAQDDGNANGTLDVNALPPAPGLIFDVQAGEYILFDGLVDRLSDRKYVLIGEKHDNPIHHHHQAQLVDALSKTETRNRAIVWEMFTRDQQNTLDHNWQDIPISELGPAMAWEDRGWPSWHDYAPIAQAARDNGLMMVAGNLPDPILRPMVTEGNSAIPDDLANQLDLPDMPTEILDRFNVEIAEGHCNMLPDSMLGGFSAVQFARDASLARAMSDATRIEDIDGAFLIAGAMHVRQTIAAPWHLRRYEPELAANDIAVVSLIEADDPGPDASLVEDYAMRFGAPDDIDFMWFTNDIARGDPCQNLGMGE
ncbi:ChaN family lipoprotein [Thalassospira sp. HF15]|uniref:ChaN family lipoprotein n=1 Tax=Thalassospira sp. HF15 TaxID=2722755 RepID=UPI0020CA5286|nr:ChaN family lipoprotein [Thalassospira sp. HF15]